MHTDKRTSDINAIMISPVSNLPSSAACGFSCIVASPITDPPSSYYYCYYCHCHCVYEEFDMIMIMRGGLINTQTFFFFVGGSVIFNPFH